MTAIEHLTSTPEIFRALMAGLNEEQAYWKPKPDRFSIAELLEHVAHVEGHYFRAIADQMVAEDNPEIEEYNTDAFIAAGTYAGRDAEESMAHWEDQREDNVEFLSNLDEAQFSRTARHPEVGQFTLANLVNEWALHDLGHIRQLAELVRAQLYYPGIGPFQVQYTVKP